MAKSLQDQLRQAGVASQKQAVRARKAQNTKEKMQRKGIEVDDETAKLVKQRDAEKLARDRTLNKERQLVAEQKAVQAQIQQIIETNAITEGGEIEFRFDHGGVIKTMMVSDNARRALIKGVLAIVGSGDALSIVPAKVANKIAERDESWLLLKNTNEEPESDIDDEYAGYEVPDDLMW